MTLRAKTLLTVGLLLLALMAVVYGVAVTIIHRGFERLEAEETQKKVREAVGEVQATLAVLDGLAIDWTGWEQAYEFLERRDERLIADVTNNDNLARSRLNLLIYIDPSGRIAGGRAFDYQGGQKRPFPSDLHQHLAPGRPLVTFQPPLDRCAGILSLTSGPMLVVARPVHNSARTRPARGVLVLGRYLDRAEIQRFQADSGLPMELTPDASDPGSVSIVDEPGYTLPSVERVSAGWIRGASTLSDIYDRPAVRLSLDLPRRIHRQELVSTGYLLGSLGLCGLLFSVATLLLLERLVLRRVAGLNVEVGHVRHAGDPSLRMPIGGKDELSGLAVSINGMLASLERSQQELLDQEEQLRQSQKLEAIGRLAGGVAHNFNNVLAVIRGYTELMLEEHAVGSSTHQSLQQVQRAAQRAADLTHQLLTFGRRSILRRRDLDLEEVVASMLALLGPVIGDELTLSLDVQPGLARAHADRSQVEQILMDLVLNARDAMPGGGTIFVELRNAELTPEALRDFPEAMPGPYVQLSVRDTGGGIDPELLPHLFEPFFTTKELGKGTGLGLATVYGSVRQNHGHVTVESTPGKGACFRVFLPRAE